MGIITAVGKLLGSTAGEGIAKPIDAIGNVIDKAFTSDNERLTHAEIMEKLKQQPDLNQVEINKTEASSGFWFVAGWRPMIGWVCGAALANDFLINPWLVWVTGKTAPMIDMSNLMVLLTGMLGMSWMRTVEKTKGVAR